MKEKNPLDIIKMIIIIKKYLKEEEEEENQVNKQNDLYKYIYMGNHTCHSTFWGACIVMRQLGVNLLENLCFEKRVVESDPP